MAERCVNHATFVIDRTYPASVERVFAAFSDPVKKKLWFVHGKGFEVESFEMDFRVGGFERSRLRFKAGTRLILTEQGAFFEGADGPQMREGGWRRLLDRLAEELGK